MTAPPESKPARLTGFRTRLLLAMMLVVSAITALAVYFAERNLGASVELELQRTFQGEVAAWHNVQDIRNAALVERSRALVRKSRIHAALEDNAPDLLYPSAENELRDVLAPVAADAGEAELPVLPAGFYRFLDQQGAVIPPASARAVGALTAAENAQLALERADLWHDSGCPGRTHAVGPGGQPHRFFGGLPLHASFPAQGSGQPAA